ncbi:MAG: flavodoxin domain-containing protein [Bacteroidales bacterium]|nr:flavodoxin domain-containing protein [Bacteroidales bacterium]
MGRQFKESQITLFNLKENTNPDISIFDGIILGAPIYAGQSPKLMHRFISTNINLLIIFKR